MSKKLLLLLALALLLGVSVFSIWKQSTVVAPTTPEPIVTPEPTPQPTPSDQPIDTSDWKTYRNEEYGFEFRYPEKYFYINETTNYDGDDSDIRIVIIEKGYSISDQNHQIFLSINSIDGIKFSHCVLNGTLIQLSSFKGKDTVSCHYNDAQGINQHQKNLENYLSFSEKGLCLGRFAFIFDRRQDEDRSSSLIVGCESGNPRQEDYKSIYDSIKFFSRQSPN
jgi:hypothetical protein